MKCSKECEGWAKYTEPYPEMEACIKHLKFQDCPWCGSPLTEDPKMITRTVTYPEPLRKVPAMGQHYFRPVIDPDGEADFSEEIWGQRSIDLRWFCIGIYLAADLAIQRTKAMIGEG